MSSVTDTKTVFRTSINGYKKEDVNKFIEEENRRFSSLEKEHLDKIDKLLRDLEVAQDEIARLKKQQADCLSLKEEVNALKAELAKKDAEAKDLQKENEKAAEDIASATKDLIDADEKIAKLSQENKALIEKVNVTEKLLGDKNTEISELRTEIERLSSENEELKAELSEAVTAADSQNASLSDAEMAQLGDMLQRVKYASEDMLKRAEEGAQFLLDRAKDSVVIYRTETINAAKEIFSAATDELRRSIGVCMNDFAAALRISKNDPARATEAAEECDEDLGRRIERMQNDLDRAIAEKLAEFKNKH